MSTLLRLFLLFAIIFAPGYCPGQEPGSFTAGGFVYKAEYRDDGSLEKVVKMDSDGNKLAEAYYGPDGRLSRNPVDSWAAAVWEYKNGNLRETRYYGDDGHLKERKSYTRSGNLKEKDYFGDDIDENEELDTEFMAADEISKYFDKTDRLKDEMESFR